jgi:hypothetical protein
MINETSGTAVEKTETRCDRRWWPSLCWSAIIGGTIAAIAIHILLATLGIGAGLATFSPLKDAHPGTEFSEATAAIWSACALVAIFFGAVIAGRFSHSLHSGFVHGIMVWSLTLIIALLLLSKGTGSVLGGGLKILGEGFGIGAKAVTSGVADTAQAGLKRSGDEMNSFVDEATQSMPTNAAAKSSIKTKRDVGFAVAKLFAPENDINSADNRNAAVKALVTDTQMSQADAETMVDGWITAYKNLEDELNNAKTAAENKARQAADQAAHDLSVAGTWTFFGLLLGLLVSAGGGVLGADFAVKRIKTYRTTTLNP